MVDFIKFSIYNKHYNKYYINKTFLLRRSAESITGKNQEGTMIKKIDHIGIAVRNLEESLEFYCGVLGFEQDGEISEPANDPGELDAMGVTPGNSYRCVVLHTPNDGVLEMFDFQNDSTPNVVDLPANSVGKLHLAFTVSDIQAEVAKLKKHGIQFYDDPREDFMGPWVYFRDPNGIILEFVQRPE